jgi:hypothetical protein
MVSKFQISEADFPAEIKIKLPCFKVHNILSKLWDPPNYLSKLCDSPLFHKIKAALVSKATTSSRVSSDLSYCPYQKSVRVSLGTF